MPATPSNEFETITMAAAIALRYSAITQPIATYESDCAVRIAADLSRDNIPHAIVQLADGRLQVWRKLGTPIPTEHRRAQHRRSASHRPPGRPKKAPRAMSPSAIPPCAAPQVPELLRQALRLAATGNRYAPTKLRAFDTLVLATAHAEWDAKGFRPEFLRIINLELKRREDLAASGRSHLLPAA